MTFTVALSTFFSLLSIFCGAAALALVLNIAACLRAGKQ